MPERNLSAAGKSKKVEAQTSRMEKKGFHIGMRQGLVKVLEKRFGPLPCEIRGKLNAIRSTGKLSQLLDKALVAGSLQELGLL